MQLRVVAVVGGLVIKGFARLLPSCDAAGRLHPRGGRYLDDDAAQRDAATVAADGGT